jgi:uncharacterized Zn-binding protein involved in type VI secretion
MPALGLVKGSLVKTGLITGPGAIGPLVRAEFKTVSVVGDTVASHGETPHSVTTIATGSSTVNANGKPVTVATVSTAFCQDQVDTGAGTVNVGP